MGYRCLSPSSFRNEHFCYLVNSKTKATPQVSKKTQSRLEGPPTRRLRLGLATHAFCVARQWVCIRCENLQVPVHMLVANVFHQRLHLLHMEVPFTLSAVALAQMSGRIYSWSSQYVKTSQTFAGRKALEPCIHTTVTIKNCKVKQ